MKTSKLIIYNILAFITSINILYVYFGGGFTGFSLTRDYLEHAIQPAILITMLFITTILISTSYVATSAKTRKNLIKISLIITSIIALASIFIRIIQAINGIYVFSLYLNTILYIILVIVNILILKDLYNLLQRLFLKENF